MYISEIICVILQCEERILIGDYVNPGSCDIKKNKMGINKLQAVYIYSILWFSSICLFPQHRFFFSWNMNCLCKQICCVVWFLANTFSSSFGLFIFLGRQAHKEKEETSRLRAQEEVQHPILPGGITEGGPVDEQRQFQGAAV